MCGWYDEDISKIGQQVPESDRRISGKREAGGKPARSRHCKQESIAIMSLSHREGSSGCLNCEPGDLPDCGTGNIGSGSRGLAVPNV